MDLHAGALFRGIVAVGLINAEQRRVKPPGALRGDIARIMLYVRDTYGFRLSRQDARLLGAWNVLDPPDAWHGDMGI